MIVELKIIKIKINEISSRKHNFLSFINLNNLKIAYIC